MSNMRELKDLVQEAVDKGATTVEEVHKAIASLPLDVLSTIDGLEKPAKSIKDIQEITIGGVYDIIRNVNGKVSQIATEIIDKIDKPKS
ncbi:MAG: hypothetical protein HOE90_21175 [Bacteriovoracaceae bacterium]|jgi:hypothetical protein|nr:hypothetical protein [Bacteriovoracaceae bacterium]